MLKATILLCGITFLIYFIDTLSYSLRLIVYYNRQYSLTGSTFNLITFAAKFAITFQSPLMGVLIDVSITNRTDPLGDFRLIMGSASIGVLFGIIMLPAFVFLFSKLVTKMANKEGSILKTARLSKDELKALTKFKIRKPSLNMLPQISLLKKYWFVCILYLFAFGVYTIGMLSAYYASSWMPNVRLSIAGFSGTVNSVATVISLILLEPRIAMITDSVYSGEREYIELKSVVIIMIITKLLGTILAQIMFVPAAKWIIFVYKVLVGLK